MRDCVGCRDHGTTELHSAHAAQKEQTMTDPRPPLSRAQEDVMAVLGRIEPATPKKIAEGVYGTPTSLRVGWAKNALQALQRKGYVASEDVGFERGNPVLVWRTIPAEAAS